MESGANNDDTKNNGDNDDKKKGGMKTILSLDADDEAQEQDANLSQKSAVRSEFTKQDEVTEINTAVNDESDNIPGNPINEPTPGTQTPDAIMNGNTIMSPQMYVQNTQSHHLQTQQQPQHTNHHQQQLMTVNQHMQSMNLVAHYEAQMRDHLAAFTQAAAGAAWAAAQLASMPVTGGSQNNAAGDEISASSNAAASAAAAAAAAASSAVSHLQQVQPVPMPLPMHYIPHDPNMLSFPSPMAINSMHMSPMGFNSQNVNMTPPFSPPNMHMQMSAQPLQTDQSWKSSPPAQYQQVQNHHHMKFNSQLQQPQSAPESQSPLGSQSQSQYNRQRNRGRNDQNTYHQNHPNKRHQKMQEQQNAEQPHDAYISLQMQQMQFQSPPKQPLHTNALSHTQMDNHFMETAAVTNKRPHSSSSSFQSSVPLNNQLESDGVPMYIPPHDMSLYPNHYIMDPNNTANNRTTRRLWSPDEKKENKRSMNKKHNHSSSPYNSDTQHNNNYSYVSKTNNNPHNNATNSNKSNTSYKPNQPSRKPNNKATRRRLHSSLDSGNSYSSGGGSNSNNNNNQRKNKLTKKRSSHPQSSNNSPRPFNPIGKTGVMALHELCSKRHWAPPKFIEIQQPTKAAKKDSFTTNIAGNNDSNSPNQPSYSPRASTLPTNSFLMSVIVYERELGRGRGGTKAAARQDAARQALSVLLPNVTFDHNGILIQVGRTEQGSYDDLAPLASRLAIDPNNFNYTDPSSSPQHSEDSFTLLSRPPYIYPCASSGMSSEGEDENSYYASRGASVCSTLLHAMWQIDPRIQEPPSYNFQVCSPPRLISSSSKRTKGDNVSYVASTPVAVHRSSFACTASIILRASKKNSSFTIDQKNDKSDNDLNESYDENKKDKKLEAIGTGATKREAKHVASAKLLALLFPMCNGMVEVMGAAEAAREEYAASKALTKQHKRALSQSNNSYVKKRDDLNNSETNSASSGSRAKNELLFALRKNSDPVLPQDIFHRLRMITQMNDPASQTSDKLKEGINHNHNTIENFISVAALSISESKDVGEPSSRNKKDNLVPPACYSNKQKDKMYPIVVDMEASLKRQLERQRQLEEEVDNVLQKISEMDDEGRSTFGGNSVDEVGRIILRRASVYDYVPITNLLLSSSQIKKTHSVSESASSTSVNPTNQIDYSPLPQAICGNIEGLNRDENITANIPSLLWGGLSLILVLSRAIAGHDEPPLGCAVLTLQFSLRKGRVLNICDMAYEGHLPRERFMECLEEFASYMKCALQVKKITNKSKQKFSRLPHGVSQLSRNQMERIFIDYCTERTNKDDEKKSLTGADSIAELDWNEKQGQNLLQSFPLSTSSLQAVEEEDSEDVEDEGRKDEPICKVLTNEASTGINQCKPSKRSRVS